MELINGVWRTVKKGSVTFHWADNMDYLRWCKEEMMWKHFHVGIVDPPYGIDVTKMNLGNTNASKPKEYDRGEWDGEVPTEEYWELLDYCCRNLIVWGGNYFVKDLGRSGRCFIFWEKLGAAKSFAAGELALTTFDKNACIIRSSTRKGGEDESQKRHDTQKPVYLYDYLHLNFVERGQRVLDTHGGSFNHAVAAYKNNVKLTIMDKNESYFLSGIENYDIHSSKGRLLF